MLSTDGFKDLVRSNPWTTVVVAMLVGEMVRPTDRIMELRK